MGPISIPLFPNRGGPKGPPKRHIGAPPWVLSGSLKPAFFWLSKSYYYYVYYYADGYDNDR
jgi:hypothetical protein